METCCRWRTWPPTKLPSFAETIIRRRANKSPENNARERGVIRMGLLRSAFLVIQKRPLSARPRAAHLQRSAEEKSPAEGPRASEACLFFRLQTGPAGVRFGPRWAPRVIGPH